MDSLEYETEWAQIKTYTDGDNCDSNGLPYFAMDPDNQRIYLCDGQGGAWSELAMQDTIPALEGKYEPAPWHGFDDITQDVWADTDTHTYVQSGPLEEQYKPHDVDQCESAPCANGGTCIDHGGAVSAPEGGDGVGDPFDDFECVCTAGFEGKTCSEYVDDCTSDPCANGATCTQDTYGYQCECVAGYDAFDCDEEIDECKYGPCVHGACVDEIDAFSCVCDSGWSGQLCDIRDESQGYVLIGIGQCVDEVNFPVDICESADDSVSTLFDCMTACDELPECRSVQFRHATALCGLGLETGIPPASGLADHFTCTANYNELIREDFESSSTDNWVIDPDGVLASTGTDGNYVHAGAQSYRMSGGAVEDSSSLYQMSLTLTSADGVEAGKEYGFSVWVYHVGDVISEPQPEFTGSTLSVADSTGVFSSTASASADARHWEQLALVFTAQADAVVVIKLSIPFDYAYDVYWDDLVGWSDGGRGTMSTDGSIVQDVMCYTNFEQPTPIAYQSCEEVKAADYPNGAYSFTDGEGSFCEYICQDETGGGKSRDICTNNAWSCLSCESILHEDESWPNGFLTSGLGQFSAEVGWEPNEEIRFEWYDSSGEWQWVQFTPASDIFVDRPTATLTGSSSDNTIIAATSVATSLTDFAAAVSSAGESAIFCLSTTDVQSSAESVAWALLPGDHSAYGNGCTNAGWAGAGIFYGDEGGGSGFVGYLGDGESKGLDTGAIHLDLEVFVCRSIDSKLQLWLKGADIVSESATEWSDHRHVRDVAAGWQGTPVTLADVTLDGDGYNTGTGAYKLDSSSTMFTVSGLDIGPSVMSELSLVMWVKVVAINSDSRGWVVASDNGGGGASGSYQRGVFLHDTDFGDNGAGQGALAMGIGQAYTSDIFMTLDEWHHIAAVWRDDGTAAMYLDNVAFEVPVTGHSVGDGASDITVGAHGSEPFVDYGPDCWLGEFQVYDYALSGTQVTDLYGNGGNRFF